MRTMTIVTKMENDEESGKACPGPIGGCEQGLFMKPKLITASNLHLLMFALDKVHSADYQV